MIVDLFAGGGGASLGVKWALGKSPDVAVNHDEAAIQMHQANHPETHHERASVWEIQPAKTCGGRRVSLLWLSPDCRHFSRAKGGSKVSPRVRTLARVAIPWAKQVRPALIVLENVQEFTTWGPLQGGRPDPQRAGLYFRRWVRDLERIGYSVDWSLLNAADFGAPTSRKRLFVVARGDGSKPNWPIPTHGQRTRLPWKASSDCIDWTIPVRSIFNRKAPLARATQRRIAAGLVRFVLDAHDFEPCPTVAAWISKFYGTSIGSSLRLPLSTISAQGQHHALCTATFGDATPEHIVSWISSYYGTAGAGTSIQLPLPTITCVDRMSLVVARIREAKIVDIGMRMLEPRELARAQGFPDSYQLTGSRRSQVHRIGNSVCPHVASAVLRANASAEMLMAA